MSYEITNYFRTRQRGGRRRDSDPPYNKVKRHVVVDDDLYDLIETKRMPYETNNEVVWRIYRQYKEVEALEQTRLSTTSEEVPT